MSTTSNPSDTDHDVTDQHSAREHPAGQHLVGQHRPELMLETEHHLCPGCGEPVAARIVTEVLAELGQQGSSVAVLGIGCYTAFARMLDIDVVQALHGRAPSVATGVKRMLPEATVLMLQGDGDMVNEGLQEVLHTAARGESVTAVLLNNGVFGETGGHMTATSVVGQRTKTSLDGRDPQYHGHPIRIADLLARIDGAAYVARGSVHSAGAVAKTKRMIRKAFEHQLAGNGFGFVEVLTMCPTGWFVPTAEGPEYMEQTLGQVHVMGELKDGRG